MGSRRWWSILLCVAAFVVGGADLSGCSSEALPGATGGSTGSMSGIGGNLSSTGGSGMGGASMGGSGMGGASMGGSGMGGTGMGGAGMGGTGMGGTGVGGSGVNGSCIPNHINPDSQAGGACSPECQSVACGFPCTENCCVPCGIDSLGFKTCVCSNPGLPYSNCTCAPPATIPSGLQGGSCSPQGYASTTAPVGAPAGLVSLKGLPCRALNLVCFTLDSTPAAERGCICMADGVMHCGSVNHWFVNNGGSTAWMP